MTRSPGAPQDNAPDSAYAWRRLAISLALSTFGGIGFWSVVVSLPAIEAEFAIDRGDASLPYMATLIGFAVGGVIMGRLSDRIGIMKTQMIGALTLGLGYFAAANAETLLQFIIAQALLIGLLGSSVSFGPLVADVSLWFVKRRGIAVAIVACGNYLSGAIWPPLLQRAIETFGWRQAHIGVGVVCIAAMLPLALALRRPAPRDEPGDKPVTRNLDGAATPGRSPRRLLMLLCVAGISCCVAMSMPQVHIVAYCGDLGYGARRGAEMLSIMLGVGVISRLGSGLIADRIGGLGTLALGSTLQCLALIFYLPFDGLTPLYIVSALFGLAQGGIVPSYALIVRDYFPAREAGAKVSIVLMSTVLGMALGGWMSGEVFDLTGSYQAAFINGIAFNLLNMSIAYWLLIGRRRSITATA